ncbi:tyrosine-type recombinase/integrase [Nocardiopsis synnemataformans]|uniref:tyrosine-type recombinase/integrase n=1 Tax=Nocardiopsis synnemataformans TaxID=61305 RepID=UPI003EB6B52C
MAVREGSTFKRCGCREQTSHKLLGAKCPLLRRRNGAWSSTHGRWGYQIELPPTSQGSRRQVRKAGLETQDEALRELAHIKALLETAGQDEHQLVQVADLIQSTFKKHEPLPAADTIKRYLNQGMDVRAEAPTVAAWLEEWLEHKPDLAHSTRASYAGHIRNHLTPHLGHLRLDRLQSRHIEAMFDAIEDKNVRLLECRESADPQVRASVTRQRVTSLSTKHRIRATLRSALTDAVRSPELPTVTYNAASHARLPSCPRKKPLVWTTDRVTQWEKDGTIPGEVMIWTPEQTSRFLTHARKYEWLYPIFHLIAFKGLRRGEAVGLPWTNVRLTDGQIDINTQVVQVGWETTTCTPKSDAGERSITLDQATTRVLKRWRRRTLEAKLAAGGDWTDSGLVFVQTGGQGWHPAQITDWFSRIARAAGLPPIGLHGLRHGAASTALAAGVDVKVVSAELGHSTTHFTQDTYQSVFPDVAKAAAEATAAMFTTPITRPASTN